MNIQDHIFIDSHIIGCSPVYQIIGETGYKIELYMTNGMHVFDSEKKEELQTAYDYINNIESFYK